MSTSPADSNTAISMQSVSLGSHDLREVFGSFPTGVTAVCALDQGVPIGMAATAFTPVSLDPPIVSVCIQSTSETWPKLQGLPSIGVSVLSAAQESVCRKLADKHGDRFAGVRCTSHDTSALFIDGSIAWIECHPFREIQAGDHALVLLKIVAIWHEPHGAPLVFHRSRFRQLLTSSADGP